MNQNNELITNDHQLPATTDIQARVDMMLANRSHIIEKVKPLLMESVDIYTLPGMKKPSLGKPGAEKLAAIFGYTADFAVDKDTIEIIGEKANGKQYLAYICNLYRHGQAVGQGRGATFIEWSRTNYRNATAKEYEAAKAMPTFNEKDWQAKAGQYGTYYRTKDGEVFDALALNKAIKMAQKSAFVDAVIRATGMSDLFTQDVEDMGTDAPEPPQQATPTGKPLPNPSDYAQNAPVVDEPFPGTPNYQKQANATPSAPQAATVDTQKAINDLGMADFPCQQCGATMKLRHGQRGDFYGCTNYPNCKNTQNV